MICPASLLRPLFLSVGIASLTACGSGGGGGGGGSSDAPPPAVVEADANHNGLIEIATLQQLDWIRNDPTGKSLTDSNQKANSKGCPTGGCFGYELVADLNFDTNGDGVLDNKDTYFDYDKNGSNAGWLPIPTLTATFEGNGHRISNLYINRSATTQQYVGLFGLVASSPTVSAGIRNLRLDGPLLSVTGNGSLAVGALAGQVTVGGQTEFRNTTQSAKVSGGGWVGGSVGAIVLTGGSLTLDHNTATSVVSGQSVVGGLAGLFQNQQSGSSATVSNNSSSSTVTAAESAGGLIGILSVNNASIVMDTNTSDGSVTATQFVAGGMIGSASGQNLMIRNSSADAQINIGGGISSAGGLIGEMGGGVLETASTAGSITGKSQLGGLIGKVSGSATIRRSHSSTIIRGDLTKTVSGPSTSVAGGFNGGLVGLIQFTASATCRIEESYSAGSVSGGANIGGLIGYVDLSTASSLTVTNNFSITPVNAVYHAGALIGSILANDSAVIEISKSLALGQTTIDETVIPGSAGGLVGALNSVGGATINLSYNQWAFDTTGRAVSVFSKPLTFVELGNSRATLAQLACTLAANNSSCAPSELFHNWNTALDANGNSVWDFGTTAELPGLHIGNAIYRPIFNGSAYTVSTEML